MLHQYIKVRKKANDKQAGENECGENVFHGFIILYFIARGIPFVGLILSIAAIDKINPTNGS